MSAWSFVILITGTVYLLVAGFILYYRDKRTALGRRDILAAALWPLDFVWPFLIAAVAVLELCLLLYLKQHSAKIGTNGKSEGGVLDWQKVIVELRKTSRFFIR